MRNPTFAAVLQTFREQRCISQSRLGRLAGVDHSTIARLELDYRRPSRGMVVSIARALDLDRADARRLYHAAGYVTEDELDEEPLVRDLQSVLADDVLPEWYREGLRQQVSDAVQRARRVSEVATVVTSVVGGVV